MMDGLVIVKSSDKTWSTGGGSSKSLQYSCRENSMNTVKRQQSNSTPITNIKKRGRGRPELGPYHAVTPGDTCSSAGNAALRSRTAPWGVLSFWSREGLDGCGARSRSSLLSSICCSLRQVLRLGELTALTKPQRVQCHHLPLEMQ